MFYRFSVNKDVRILCVYCAPVASNGAVHFSCRVCLSVCQSPGLSVCLCVCFPGFSKTCGPISMKLSWFLGS